MVAGFFMSQTGLEGRIYEFLSPLIESEGFLLWDVEFGSTAGRKTLRVLVDRKEGGVNLDDCSHLNRILGDIIEVKNFIPFRYDLEISSPGLDRPLKKREHFLPYVGRVVSVKTKLASDGRRNYKGVLKTVDDDRFIVEVDKVDYPVGFDNLFKAKLEI
ncbi:MAG TPA: ribosome maturation factor RimP [Deltaproteobacteria bacterium]|nr:ribosome maturation factor RimP [Deltaproteobacteria bacterium]